MIGRSISRERHEKINSVLLKHGLNPALILERSLEDDRIYEKIVLDNKGQRKLTVAGDIQTKKIPWPKGCWEEIQEVLK